MSHFKFLVAVCLITTALVDGAPMSGTDDQGLILVGDLTKTQHKVSGTVYIADEHTILIRDFTYDGDGFGVYINVATDGSSIKDYIKNRIPIGHPDPEDVSQPLEEEFKPSDHKEFVVKLPATVTASSIKWLSVWCDVFKLSFGHVLFPSAS